MTHLLGSSVADRVAFEPQGGRKALVLRARTAPAGEDIASERVATGHGFCLHTGVGSEAHQRAPREWLCRYIARPAVTRCLLSANT